MPSGRAIYPGLLQVESWNYTRSHGITPGIATLVIVPQPAGFVPEGNATLEFQWEGVTVFQCPNSKIDSGSLRFDAQGRLISVAILDRRWKWSFGQLDGHYNLRDDSNEVIPDTEKTPQELATLCLEAMGESGFLVDDLPNDSRPEVKWQAENPAQVLQKICEDLGCRIVYQLDDSVAIRKVGTGASLPIEHRIDGSSALDPPEVPDRLRVVCGFSRFQHDFALEAVGKQLDGKIVPIDDLTYTPADGWGVSISKGFADLKATDTDAYLLAAEHIFRWYRIVLPANISGYGDVEKIEYVLPIENKQVETRLDNGREVAKDAAVFGTFASPAGWGSQSDFNVAEGTTFTGRFSIDRKTGVVIFPFAVYQIASAGSPAPFTEATLFLRVAVSIRNPVTWAWTQKTFDRSLAGGNFNTGPQLLHHDELVFQTYPSYSADGITIIGENNNEARLQTAADYYLDAASQQYNQTNYPEEIRYAGLKYIELDGAIHQVQWTGGRDGFFTHASRNDEFSLVVPRYQERRRRERLRDAKTIYKTERLKQTIREDE